MKTAKITFYNRDNAYMIGSRGKQFIGNNTIALFELQGCDNDELLNILNYKSWLLRRWGFPTARQYFVHKHSEIADTKTVWCLAGFSSILIRYLQNRLGYTIYGKEAFQAKDISVPNMKYSLWDFQREAIKAWLDSGAYGIIKSPTASGKTFLGTYVTKKMSTRTIILVHSKDLLINVWFNYLVEQFGERIKEQIGIVGGGLSKKDRMLMHICGESFNENISKDIVISTGQSLLNHLDRLGKENFGLMIVDEIHHWSSEQFNKVASVIKAPSRLGLSATILRPDGTTPMFKGLIGEVVYRISIRELASKGLLVEPTFHSIIISDEDSENKIRSCNLKMLEFARYVKTISASSKNKFSYILQLCARLKHNKSKFMLYTDFVNKGEKGDDNENVKIRDEYMRILTFYGLKVASISADMNTIERQNMFIKLENGELDGLIFGSLGSEGINLPSVEAIICCNATASTIKFPQRTGRAMRKHKNKTKCDIYEILLNTPKELEWAERCFVEYANEGFEKEIIYIT